MKDKDLIKFNNENLPEWDLSYFYKSINDKKIDKDLEEIKNNISIFIKKYKDISDFEIKDLELMIKDYYRIILPIYNLSIYSYLLFAKDSLNNDYVAFYSKINDFISNFNSDLNFFSIKISKIEEDKINILLKDNRIYKYKSIIQNIRKFNKHRLNEEMEKFSIEKSNSLDSNIVKFYDQKLAKMKFRFKDKDLNLSEAFNLLQENDKDVRESISKEINIQFKEILDDYIFIFNTILKSKEVEDKFRKYEFSSQSQLISNDLDKKTLDIIVQTVEDSYENTSHKYYKIKANILGLKQLKYSDRNSPIGNFNKKYSWQEAIDFISNSYLEFSDIMFKNFNWFIENRRIDAKILKAKRSGAFCTNAEPFVFLNYDFSLNGLTTLAHEIGHAIQMKLSKDKYGFEMSDANLALAEIPSTFSEALVYNYIINNSANNDEKIAVLIKKIEGSINTISRQIAFHRFEEDIHNLRKERELTADDFSKIWLKRMQEYLGSGVDVEGSNIEYIWPYVSHFIHSPFYVHSYSFADLVTNCLMKIYKSKELKNFSDLYVNFFTDSSVENYKNLIKRFNFNPEDSNFWKIGLKEIEQDILKLESLI